MKDEKRTKTMTVISAKSEQSTLELFADKASDVIGPLVDSLIVKGEEVKQGPVTVMRALVKLHGAEVLRDEFPRLGTTYKNHDNNPEKFQIDVETDGGDGQTHTKTVKAYDLYWLRTKRGQEIAFVTKQLKLANDPKTRDKAEPKYQNMTPTAIANMLKTYKGKLTAGANMIRRAVGCWHVMCDLAEYKDRVILRPALDGDGKPVVSLSPFDLEDATRNRMFRPISVSDALRIDLKAALNVAGAGGNLYDAIVAQFKRKPKGGSGGGKLEAIQKPGMLLNHLAVVNNYIDAGSDDGDEHQNDVRSLLANAKPEARDIYILQIGSARRNLNALWDDALEIRYRRLIDAKIRGDAEVPAAVENKATKVA